MKKITILVLIAATLLCGCSNKQVKTNENSATGENPSPSITQSAVTPKPTSEITFDDQEQVVELIMAYVNALERKDYTAAWELTSTEQKKQYSKEDATINHWGIESARFISMDDYLPATQTREMTSDVPSDVPSDTPTIWFSITLNIKPAPKSAWNDGMNERFVNVIKENDGKWRINGLATSP